MPRRTNTAARRAFTLIELILAMMIMSLVTAVVTPVILSATDAYASARTLRNQSETASFSVDRVVRALREAPSGTATRLGITTATADTIIFTDGQGLQLTESTLELVTPDGTAPIARDVESFTIEYLDEDGLTPVDDPANAHRFHVSIELPGQSLRVCAFPRVNVGGGS